MTDHNLVERLRGIDEESMYQEPATTRSVTYEAAARIEALTAELARVRGDADRLAGALETVESTADTALITDMVPSPYGPAFRGIRTRARQALSAHREGGE